MTTPTPDPLPTCDRTKTSDESPIPHDYQYLTDEYGSLADGGSYEVYACTRCGRRAYSALPD